MQNLYLVPKSVLSYYVKQVFESGFNYIEQSSFYQLGDLIQASENKQKLLFNVDRFKAAGQQSLLFICLPYKLDIWKQRLIQYFQQEIIQNLFQDFDGQTGIAGTYSKGFLIVVNADKMKQLKDTEEIVQHQLVHFFRLVNEDSFIDLKLSCILQRILMDSSEYETYTINLMNRIDKLFYRYLVKHKLTDCEDIRRKFLDQLFQLARVTNSFQKLVEYLRDLDSSKLLEDNIYFLWVMCHWVPAEFEDFKNKIYKNFLQM